MKINRLVVDSTDSITDLCALGIAYGTDKSPYNLVQGLHKHPYTAVYDLLFSNIRYNELNIAEIGILDNASMNCWRRYFPNSNLFGYEFDEQRIQNAKDQDLSNTKYYRIDVKSESSIEKSFSISGKRYNVLIEDSTHVFEDQIRVINIAYKYMKPGGIMVVEDIFRNEDEKRYEKSLEHLSKYFSSATFIITEHEKKFSPGWDNDKLLILFRNNVS
jgi:hypothetical protein